MNTELIEVKLERFAVKFQGFVGENIPILVLIGLLIFLLFGKKIRFVNALKYTTMYVTFVTLSPLIKIKNRYLLALVYIALFIAVEIFFNTFYHTKPEYFKGDEKQSDSSLKTDDLRDDDSDVEIEEGDTKDEDGVFQDNNLEAGTIENVTYADASYKYKMSDLDGMVLERKNEWRIMPKPDSVPLSDRKEFIPQGHDVPLNPNLSRTERLDNVKPPFVDGIEGSARSMVMFDKNVVSLQCCPSTWSTDRGCVCTSTQQREFINKRGGNRTYSNDQI